MRFGDLFKARKWLEKCQQTPIKKLSAKAHDLLLRIERALASGQQIVMRDLSFENSTQGESAGQVTDERVSIDVEDWNKKLEVKRGDRFCYLIHTLDDAEQEKIQRDMGTKLRFQKRIGDEIIEHQPCVGM